MGPLLPFYQPASWNHGVPAWNKLCNLYSTLLTLPKHKDHAVLPIARVRAVLRFIVFKSHKVFNVLDSSTWTNVICKGNEANSLQPFRFCFPTAAYLDCQQSFKLSMPKLLCETVIQASLFSFPQNSNKNDF